MTHDLSAPPDRADAPEPVGAPAPTADPENRDGASTSAAVSTASAGRGDAARALRRLALRVHFYAGVLVGPFLLVAALTGFVYALSPSIEKVVYHSWTASASDESIVPLEEQVATAESALPGLRLDSVITGRPGENTRVLFADPSLPSSSYERVAFVDPSTGDVAATSVQYGSGQALPFRTWISEMHRRLHIGEPGRVYSELAASWLTPITLFGLYLWWDRRRRSGAPFFRLRRGEARAMGLLGGPTRAGQRSRHAIVGVWIAIAFVFLSATGLTWSRFAGENVSELRAELGWTTPTLDTSAAAPEHAGHDQTGGDMSGMDMSGMDMAGMDMAGMDMSGMSPEEHAAMAADPLAPLASVHDVALDAGLSEPLQITPAAEGGGPWTVAETRRSYTAGPDTLAVDPASGDVVGRLDFADYPLAAKLADWGIRAHMGFLFGIANQLLLAAVAAGLAGIVVRGYVMWWKRRPTRGVAAGRLAPAPPAGAYLDLVRAHPLATCAASVLVVVVGWFVPLLGASLLVFLVLDLVLRSARGVTRITRVNRMLRSRGTRRGTDISATR